MAANKTTENTASVDDFINKITDETKRHDGHHLAEIMKEESGFEAKMWGNAIVGFGSYHYKYESGREGDAPLVAFSPRANDFSLYISPGDAKTGLLQKFGKHKMSGSCIHVKRLVDINEDVLRELVRQGVKNMQEKHPQV
ncbi:DUF1801 domain-containing protein [Mucilaginibacter sp. 14171R-50]|uniref:DUF1801 domain-containing protein n=1 Tax=Mucilaginibacter sp. 14171R-50 TaxID=2703789 RepID=UPI00138C392B|nr:DUF1801 domain-containing protein [Mucilaginibacter sp. 14171R-50]QHS56889.1 DUF1801 domain-containing protein [Mucilaginibacter sp. 14171R-50]